MHALTRTCFALALAGALACSGGSDGAAPTPTAPPPPTVTESSTANFRVAGAAGSQRYNLDSDANTVFCDTNAGWATLWIRLSESPSGDGGGGAHIDIDVCNHSGGGSYSPKDPDRLSCSGAKEFDLWWHGEDGTVFNNATSGACMLDMTETDGRLIGMFECSDITETGGTETVDVRNGSFDCAITGS